jgi:hypothetical protein
LWHVQSLEIDRQAEVHTPPFQDVVLYEERHLARDVDSGRNFPTLLAVLG